MKQRHLFESVMISAIVVTLLATVVSANGYPGPDIDTNYGYCSYGTHVYSSVTAYYGSPTCYTYASLTSARAAGIAQYYGDMYYCWFIGSVYIQGYSSSNVHTASSSINCTQIAAYTVADFKYGAQEWTCDALAYVQVS